MNANIIHHGAFQGVTGSCHQLFIDEINSLLIDCGLFQGAETAPDGTSGADRLEIPFPLERVQALVATHVHIDHVGRIPWLLAAGFKGPILCSEPSAKLLPVVLADAFAVGVTRDARLVERYLKMVEARIRPIPWRTWYPVFSGPQGSCRIRLQRAGHILGSAYVECELSRPGGERLRVLFSGDLGAPHAPLLSAPRPPWSADVVVLESTYGDQVHEKRSARRARLQAVVEKALGNGGTVIIPAFSIGRTQELLYEFEDILYRQRQKPGRFAEAWAKLPIYLDSPLAGRFTRIYRELQVHECYATLGPMNLAASLLGKSGDCLAQPAPGPETLKNPEPRFFILGAKSYGRNSAFLIQLGLSQIRSAYALLHKDPGLDLYAADAADAVAAAPPSAAARL